MLLLLLERQYALSTTHSRAAPVPPFLNIEVGGRPHHLVFGLIFPFGGYGWLCETWGATIAIVSQSSHVILGVGAALPLTICLWLERGTSTSRRASSIDAVILSGLCYQRTVGAPLFNSHEATEAVRQID